MNDQLFQMFSRELARWVISGAVGFCVTFWGTVVAVLIYPDIMDIPARIFLIRFGFCQFVIAVTWYLTARFLIR